jgi:hypothetical protein
MVDEYLEDMRGALLLHMESQPHKKKLDRVKELLTEKFNYLKDTVGNNKRQTVYIVATIGSGIACYAITGNLQSGLAGSMVSSGLSIAHNELQEK